MSSSTRFSLLLAAFATMTSVFASSKARAADFVLDFDGLYFSDATSAANKSSESATLYSAFAGFGVDKNNFYQLGWNYSNHTTNSVDAATTIGYAATEMGPEAIMYLNKDRNWRVSLAYDLQANANYTYTGATTEKWEGSALNADIGYQYRWDSDLSIGLRLNYSLDSYSQSVVGSTTTAESYSKTIIYPSLALTLEM